MAEQFVVYWNGFESKPPLRAFDAVLLMGYFWNADKMVQHFRQYASILGNQLVYFGVSPTKTPIDEVIDLTRFEPQGEPKGGMMEFNINADAAFGMCNKIISNLPRPDDGGRKHGAMS